MFATLPREFSESFPAVPGSVPPARSAVSRFAAQHGFSGAALDAVRTAVTEAVTNAVRHAYSQSAGAIYLTAAVTGEELTVLVADDGCGYQTPSAQPGLGLGLTLIARYSEAYVVAERATGGTEVQMRFLVPPSSEIAAH